MINPFTLLRRVEEGTTTAADAALLRWTLAVGIVIVVALFLLWQGNRAPWGRF